MKKGNPYIKIAKKRIRELYNLIEKYNPDVEYVEIGIMEIYDDGSWCFDETNGGFWKLDENVKNKIGKYINDFKIFLMVSSNFKLLNEIGMIIHITYKKGDGIEFISY